MGLIDGLKKAVETAGQQITSSSPKPKDIYFTANFHIRAKQWGLSEADAIDVYYHGSERKTGKMVKKYNGYEIALYYGKNKTTGQVYISSIWKSPRR